MPENRSHELHKPKVWQKWPGENLFRCNGRGITGPDRLYFTIAAILITIPTVAFCGAVLPNIARILPYGWIVSIPEVFLAIVVTTCFFITAYSDPGIIPRLPSPITSEDPFAFERLRPPAFKDFVVNGIMYQSKYCDTCHIYRPPRAVHCGICNNCVDRFDHHCPWVGNCVGRRNYVYFLVFIYGIMIKCGLVEAFSIIDIYYRYYEVETVLGLTGADAFRELMKNPASLLLCFYCLSISIFVGILAIFHCRLVSNGINTNEHIKGTYRSNNPYDRGCLGNWAAMCCPPVYPTYVQWDDEWVELKPPPRRQSATPTLAMPPSTRQSRASSSRRTSSGSGKAKSAAKNTAATVRTTPTNAAPPSSPPTITKKKKNPIANGNGIDKSISTEPSSEADNNAVELKQVAKKLDDSDASSSEESSNANQQKPAKKTSSAKLSPSEPDTEPSTSSDSSDEKHTTSKKKEKPVAKKASANKAGKTVGKKASKRMLPAATAKSQDDANDVV